MSTDKTNCDENTVVYLYAGVTFFSFFSKKSSPNSHFLNTLSATMFQLFFLHLEWYSRQTFIFLISLICWMSFINLTKINGTIIWENWSKCLYEKFNCEIIDIVWFQLHAKLLTKKVNCRKILLINISNSAVVASNWLFMQEKYLEVMKFP